METIKAILVWPFDRLVDVVSFIGGFFKEPDGNGGKPSFTRIVGAYVVWNIVQLSWDSGRGIPPEWMTMFWVLIGYQVVAKILGSLSPAVLDIARGFMLKAGANVNIPPPPTP